MKITATLMQKPLLLEKVAYCRLLTDDKEFYSGVVFDRCQDARIALSECGEGTKVVVSGFVQPDKRTGGEQLVIEYIEKFITPEMQDARDRLNNMDAAIRRGDLKRGDETVESIIRELAAKAVGKAA